MKDDERTIFENKYAEGFQERDVERTITEHEAESDNKEATTFKNKTAFMIQEHNLRFQGSPLGRHTPKILPHPIKGKSSLIMQ